MENLVFQEVNRICTIKRVDVVAAEGVRLAGVVQTESHAVCFLDFRRADENEMEEHQIMKTFSFSFSLHLV